jgi:hypothetical protein
MITYLQNNNIIKGMISGFVAAVVIDLHSFFKSPTWKIDDFSWAVATKRWANGLVSG